MIHYERSAGSIAYLMVRRISRISYAYREFGISRVLSPTSAGLYSQDGKPSPRVCRSFGFVYRCFATSIQLQKDSIIEKGFDLAGVKANWDKASRT
jgi:hypothetical protein